MSTDEYESYTKMIDNNRKSAKPIIPPQLAESETSPLRISVSETDNSLSVDLADYPDQVKKRQRCV